MTQNLGTWPLAPWTRIPENHKAIMGNGWRVSYD